MQWHHEACLLKDVPSPTHLPIMSLSQPLHIPSPTPLAAPPPFPPSRPQSHYSQSHPMNVHIPAHNPIHIPPSHPPSVVKPPVALVWQVGGSILGGEQRNKEKARLRKGITVLVASPGRLLDHLEKTAAFKTDELRWLVLDEADRLLDMGFQQKIGMHIASFPPYPPLPTFSQTQPSVPSCASPPHNV